MAVHALRLGPNAKLYYATSDTWGSETWGECVNVSELTLLAEYVEATGPDRQSGLEAVAKTLARISMTGMIRVNELEASFQALQENFLLRDNPINLLCLNGPKDSDGARGYKGYHHIMQWEEAQNMSNVLFKRFTIKPAIVSVSSFPYKSVVVAAGSPAYTSFLPPA
jgi:hypothetical protein